LSFNVNETWRTYRGLNRDDAVFEANVGLQHSLTQRWSIGASYSYQNNHTNASTSSFQASRYQLENYTRQVVSLWVSCHY
jgi:outer membrane autotransporter protein